MTYFLKKFFLWISLTWDINEYTERTVNFQERYIDVSNFEQIQFYSNGIEGDFD